jgi:hypothetical protein
VGGIFGFIFGLFFLFLFFGLIFGLFRAAFGWGHGGRHLGWGYRHGGYGRHPYNGERRYFEAWHRELHGEAPSASEDGPGSNPRTPGPDTA